MIIESDKVIVNQTSKQLFDFLEDFNNIGKLMPPQVEGWKSDGETCIFTIKGMATLGMAYESKTPNSEIVIKKDGKAPFDFKLLCKIQELSPTSSQLQLMFDADLNMMMRMMAEKPLTNFLNLLVHRYAEISNTIS